MSETLWGQSLAEFRDAIASTSPTPGGGSVAMVSATFGMGLVLMALEITAKKPTPGSESALRELLEQGRVVLADLAALADEDVKVFQAYMSASRLPRATEAEKTARQQALQAATVQATKVPLHAARTCLAALELSAKAASFSSVRVVSDVGAGVALLSGAVFAVLLNVDINVPSLADDALRTEFLRDRADLAQGAATRSQAVMSQVAGRIASGK